MKELTLSSLKSPGPQAPLSVSHPAVPIAINFKMFVTPKKTPTAYLVVTPHSDGQPQIHSVCGKCSLWTLQVHLCIRAFFSLLNISSCRWATCYLSIRTAWTSGFIFITGCLLWTILGMSVHRWTLAYNSLSYDFSTLWLYKSSMYPSNRNYIMGLGR